MTQQAPTQKIKRPWWRKAIRATLWTLMAIVLFIFGVLAATVTILKPSRLTPLTERIANRVLNADVTLGRVELSMRGSFPFLNLNVDSLVIISRDIKSQPAAVRDSLPIWADTLASVGRIHGGINIAKLPGSIIALSDVEICRPRINLLIVNDKLNNFSIALPSEEQDTSAVEIPDIRLDRFRITDPEPLRYVEMTDNMHLTASLKAAEIVDQQTDPSELPIYKVHFETNINSPLFEFFGLQDMPIGLNGLLEWRHERPCELALRDFDFVVSVVSGRLNTHLDFTDQMCVKDFDINLAPLSVSSLLAMIPADMAQEYSIPRDIHTDAIVALSARLNRPYTVGTDLLPDADINVDIPQCYFNWRQIDVREFALDLTAHLAGDNLNDATAQIDRLTVAGPATKLDIKGTVSNPIADPLFDGSINGDILIDNLPAILMRNLGGTMRGRLTAQTDITARPSMFSRDKFHLLRLKGDIDLDDFYFLSDDTANMVFATHACLRFGTNESTVTKRGHKIDSLLTAKLVADSIAYLHSDYSMHFTNLKLGVGSLNSSDKSDTTAIIPMGGRLELGAFSFVTLSDSAGFKMRNVDGSVAMRRYKGDAHAPLFNVMLNIGRLSTGDNSTRFMLSKAQLKLMANKLIDGPRVESRKRVKHIADSLKRIHPYIPLDSIYTIALEIHNRHRRPGHHRIHPAENTQDQEIIDWGSSTAVRRLLLDWNLRGSLTAERARLFTAAFPVRNRVKNFNIKFNNDSVTLTNVAYKAGHSDFLVSGNISNIKRAFTSRRYASPLKIHFDVLSDTIDINELAHAFFTGASASAKNVHLSSDNEAELEHQLDHKDKADTVGPLLIPVNINAEFKVKSANVLYSDLILQNLCGSVLAYDGALNLHDLQASSKVGSVNLSALYCAPSVNNMHFGFGMKLNDFNIANFLKLVPAVDSIMPLMRDIGGIINAKIAATSRVDSEMNLVLPTLHAAINLEGDSLVLLDEETFHSVAKWLLFKDKHSNMIKHMAVEMIVEDNEMQLFPFVFDFDRYRIGVQGHNDLAMNFDYHISVLKSPLPFKFGINIKGNSDKYKVRLGRAHFNEKLSAERVAIVDTTRVNLLRQFENVFRRGVRNSRFATLDISKRPQAADIDLNSDTLTRADSLYFIREGLIPSPPQPPSQTDNGQSKHKRKR